MIPKLICVPFLLFGGSASPRLQLSDLHGLNVDEAQPTYVHGVGLACDTAARKRNPYVGFIRKTWSQPCHIPSMATRNLGAPTADTGQPGVAANSPGENRPELESREPARFSAPVLHPTQSPT